MNVISFFSVLIYLTIRPRGRMDYETIGTFSNEDADADADADADDADGKEQ